MRHILIGIQVRPYEVLAVCRQQCRRLNLWPEGDPEPSVTASALAMLPVRVDKTASGPALPPRQIPAPPQILPDG